jgi:uncharacterized protein YkwD
VASFLLATPAVSARAAQATPEHDLLSEINDARHKRGLRPYRPSPALRRSAARQGRWMMRGQSFSHANRIRASGHFRSLGEALSWHQGRGSRPGWTVRGWLASSGHRPLLLSSGFRWAGMAKVTGRLNGQVSTIWVLQLGSR